MPFALSERRDSTDIAPWDRALLQSRDFLALPTVGALVEGWLLVVPKEPYLCVGAMPRTVIQRFRRFLDTVIDTVKLAYGDASVFEHGPTACCQSAGCGVDHAHVHVVPVGWELTESAEAVFDGDLLWHDVASLEVTADYFQRGLPYLYVEQPAGQARIATHASFPSQLMRRAIAQSIGIPNQFNWRDHPMRRNVVRTIERIQEVTNGLESQRR